MIYIWSFQKGIIVSFFFSIPQIDRLTEEMKKIQTSKDSIRKGSNKINLFMRNVETWPNMLQRSCSVHTAKF